jgi:hypothetical protein
MTMPGFNAETSLAATSSQYRSAGAGIHRGGGTAASQVVACYYASASGPGSFRFCPSGYSYRCQWVYIGAYERYWECGCFRNWQVGDPI